MAEIKIFSVIDDISESGNVQSSEKSEVSYPCTVTVRSDEVVYAYDEHTDGGDAKSEITVKDDSVTVTRRGAIESELVFKPGERLKSLYTVPPYSFDTFVTCKKIRKKTEGNRTELNILYKMEIGGAEKDVRMKISVSEGV